MPPYGSGIERKIKIKQGRGLSPPNLREHTRGSPTEALITTVVMSSR